MKIFGINISKEENLKKSKQQNLTFAIDKEDKAYGVTISSGDGMGGLAGIDWMTYTVPESEVQLINEYRKIAMVAEVDEALEEIRNEIFVTDVEGRRSVELDFVDHKNAPSKEIQTAIKKEYEYLYEEILDFDNNCTQFFDDWYIDGKFIIHKVVDSKRPQDGIQDIVRLDPMNVRKFKKLPKPELERNLINLADIQEFYVYATRFDQKYTIDTVNTIDYFTNIQGLIIKPDAITFVDSGLFDRCLGTYVGYLKKAIIPYNNLRMMEDAMLIFRVVRAPSRRAFYIDVDNMPTNQAEAYIQKQMARFKNKMVYNSETGTVVDRRNMQSMLEDYWLPRKNGRTTEIQTIEGQNAQDILEEVEYYRNKFWRALNVPMSRFTESAAPFQYGRNTELQRDEYRFKKYINKLRKFFMRFMEDLLRTQLILKKVIKDDEWEYIKKYMFFVYTEDNAMVEVKEAEIINNSLNTLQLVDPYIGRFFSEEWVMKNVLRMTNEEIKENQRQISKEGSDKELEQKQEQGMFSGGQPIDYTENNGGAASQNVPAKAESEEPKEETTWSKKTSYVSQ